MSHAAIDTLARDPSPRRRWPTVVGGGATVDYEYDGTGTPDQVEAAARAALAERLGS